ncbi:MAG: hypothetical protein HOP12_12535 [Candidatus Eisenbacteria bacterium]|uniref:Uncharacterized protein n=1 Tax=Eiseniibacteriota bacterium TaxID=2212470 RepID=A0A849SHX0_UNCEI|nr:hypothetical protein [Candidatus Eisenbacteria bacterium]
MRSHTAGGMALLIFCSTLGSGSPAGPRWVAAQELPPPTLATSFATSLDSVPRSAAWFLELGQRSDLTNEQFIEFEDLFIDSTFAGDRPRLVSDPEGRIAGLLSAGWSHAGIDRGDRRRFRADFEWGTQVQRSALEAEWAAATASGWRWLLAPRTEYREDRTFDRDQREWRGAATAAVRRDLDDGMNSFELRLRGDGLRASGTSSTSLLDRNTAGATLAFDHSGLLSDARLAYSLAARAFPDSASRDHVEHVGEASVRAILEGGQLFTFETRVVRRAARREQRISRDDFWQPEASTELAIHPGATTRVRLAAEGEGIAYDRPDSALYFDSQRFRGVAAAEWERAGGLRLELEAAHEWAFAPAAPAEEYGEWSSTLRLGRLGAGAWWSLEPRIGWRSYATSNGIESGAPSSFVFYEGLVQLEQPLPAGLLARVTATARSEEHDDASQDARSFWLTAELRWRVAGSR